MDDDRIVVFPKQKVRNIYNAKYQKTYSNQYYVLKHDFIKDTRICWTYPIIKQRATGCLYLKGSPYRDAEGFSQIRLCLHDANLNSAPRIGGKIEKLELYRQCPP